MEMIIPPGGLLMTSVEIATLTNKRHDQVLRTARDLAAQGITQSVECQYRASVGGREYPMHQLTKRDSLVLVARLSPEFTGRIVDRWMELEAVIAVPTIKTPATFSAALRLAAEQAEIIEEQAAKITSDAPKVLFAETIRAIDGVCHIDKGYFTVIEGNPYKDSKGVDHPTFTAMVTGAGQVFLVRKYAKAGEAEL